MRLPYHKFVLIAQCSFSFEKNIAILIDDIIALLYLTISYQTLPYLPQQPDSQSFSFFARAVFVLHSSTSCLDGLFRKQKNDRLRKVNEYCQRLYLSTIVFCTMITLSCVFFYGNQDSSLDASSCRQNGGVLSVEIENEYPTYL